MRFQGQRWWLVGASEGLGLALAQALKAEGADLILSARSEGRLKAAAADLGAEAVVMDVASELSVAEAAAKVGPVDGMVWLAGVYWPVNAQDWKAEEVLAMLDVNLTGCARVLGHVVPGMVARGSGHLVITGSLSAYRGLPGAVGYAASKAGVMVLAESLALDLRGTGVRVQLANPGFIRTRLTDKNGFDMPQIMTPEAAAGQMMRLMRSNRFRRVFPAPFAWLFRLGQIMPDRLWSALFRPDRG